MDATVVAPLLAALKAMNIILKNVTILFACLLFVMMFYIAGLIMKAQGSAEKAKDTGYVINLANRHAEIAIANNDVSYVCKQLSTIHWSCYAPGIDDKWNEECLSKLRPRVILSGPSKSRYNWRNSHNPEDTELYAITYNAKVVSAIKTGKYSGAKFFPACL